jgi:hypothetical protein
METRTQGKLRNMVIAGLAAFAAGSLLFAQGQDTGANGRPADKVREAQIVVAHGLAMASEASTLDSLAMRRTGPVAVPRTTSGIGPDDRGATTGTGPGGTVSRAPYGSDDNGRGTAGESARRASATGTGASNPAGPTDIGRPTSDPTATELHRHAMKAFDASDRLLKQAPQGDPEGPGARFQAAAIRYATTLRSLSEQNARGVTVVGPVLERVPETPVGPSPGTGTGALSTPGVTADRVVEAGVGDTTNIGRDAAGGPNVVGAEGAVTVTIGARPLSIVVLNHAVKEALDSMQLRKMVRLMGSSDSPAGRALLAHAREMETASLTAVEGVLAAGKSGSRTGANPNAVATDNPAGGQGERLQQLALQASDVVMAISELTSDRAPVGTEKGNDQDSDRTPPKPEVP